MITANDAEAARPKGRPRSRATGRAITEATLDLIVEHQSIEALSIEAVAARAGVGKATIYRRWPNKEALVIDAVSTLRHPLPPLPGTSVRDDLLAMATAFQRAGDTREGRIYPCLAGELKRNPKLAKYHDAAIEGRREVLRKILARGITTGELRDDFDIEVFLPMFMAPLMTVVLYGLFPSVDPETLPEQLVDHLLAGIAAD